MDSIDNTLLQAISPYRQFVVTRPADKIPLRAVDLNLASVTNPQDWCSYEEAAAKVAVVEGLLLGFVLTDDDPFSVVDLDTYNASDDTVKTNHNEIFKSFATYTELSPSGFGAHIWCRGWVPNRKVSSACLEVFSSGKYYTITFNAVNPTDVTERQSLLDELVASIDAATGQRKSKAPTVWVEQSEQFSDQNIIKKCSTDAKGQRFVDLWYGRWSTILEVGKSVYPSQSEADLALCNHIAVYTNNMQQCGRIFRMSQLGQRKKAQRDSYLFNHAWGIVAKAFDQKLSAELHAEMVKQWQHKQFEAVTLQDAARDSVLPVVELPSGLIGDIATYIYNQSIYRNPEVAIVGAIALLAFIGGRAFNINGTGLNKYLVLLGETSVGKEDMSRGIGTLYNIVRAHIPPIVTYCISRGDFASAQGLIKQLAETPSMLVNKGEIGLLLKSLNAPGADQTYLGLLKAALMQLYHKSGFNDTLDGKSYSDKKDNVPDAKSPALTIVSDSTHDNFYQSIDEENIDEGLVTRFTVVPVPKRKRVYNENSFNYRTPPDSLVARLTGYAKRAVELQMTQTIYNMPETPEAHAFQLAYVNALNYEMDNDPSPFAKLKSRAHIMMLRLGALIATGNNPDTPEITVADYQWAQKLIETGFDLTRQRFEAGRVGNPALIIEQRAVVKKYLTCYINSPNTAQTVKTYELKSEAMWDAKAISFSAIYRRHSGLACFRKDKNSSLAMHNVLREFERAGWIMKSQDNYGKRAGEVWYVMPDIEAT
jgi:hypothetical protein